MTDVSTAAGERRARWATRRRVRRDRPRCAALAERHAPRSSSACAATDGADRGRSTAAADAARGGSPPTLDRPADGAASYEGFAESANAGGDPHAFFDHSPIIGQANPLAPPIELAARRRHGRRPGPLRSRLRGSARGVHGGYVAAAFDEVLGTAQSLAASRA